MTYLYVQFTVGWLLLVEDDRLGWLGLDLLKTNIDKLETTLVYYCMYVTTQD